MGRVAGWTCCRQTGAVIPTDRDGLINHEGARMEIFLRELRVLGGD